MRVEEDDVFRHRVLNEVVLEVPEAKIGYLGCLGVGYNQDVAWLEVTMYNGTMALFSKVSK